MSKNNIYKHIPFEVKITTQSPVHIGTGETLSSTGEYFAEGKSHIHILDNDKLMKYLQDEGKLNEYIDKITEQGEKFKYVDTLRDLLNCTKDNEVYNFLKNGITRENGEKISFSQRELRLKVGENFGVNDNNILRLHVRTRGGCYIAGTTLKGAIRAAIVLQRLSEDKEAMQRFNQLVGQCISDENVWYFTRNLTNKEKEEGEINWDDFEQEYCTPIGQIPDFMRFTDSDTIDDEGMCVHQVVRELFYPVYDKEGNSYKQAGGALDWLVECIAPDTELRSRLTFYAPENEPQLDFLKKDKTGELHRIINQHTRRLIEVELQQLQREDIPMLPEKTELRDKLVEQLKAYRTEIDEANKEYALLRLGKGKPLFFITIAALIKDLHDRQEFMRIALKREEEADEKKNIIPRTRTLAAHHDERLMLGWVRVQFVVPPKPEVPVPDNQRESIEEQVEIKALVTKTNPKQVAFKINGNLDTDVQYVLDRQHKKEPIEVGDIIKVRIHKMNQDKIEQVKYIK